MQPARLAPHWFLLAACAALRRLRRAHPALTPDGARENVRSATHAGLIGDGGAFGTVAAAFLFGERAQAIYAAHGLLPFNGK